MQGVGRQNRLKKLHSCKDLQAHFVASRYRGSPLQRNASGGAHCCGNARCKRGADDREQDGAAVDRNVRIRCWCEATFSYAPRQFFDTTPHGLALRAFGFDERQQRTSDLFGLRH